MGELELQRVTGVDLIAAIDDIAWLRMEVFREYPYLYDGTLEYEQKYLRTYCASPQAMAILVRDTDDGRIVGASTGVPLEHETEEFLQPFVERGFDPGAVFYCGESVLLEDHRGKGVYRRFFDMREEYGRSLGMRYSCFCGVVRPDNHPLRPYAYRPLDEVWKHFGYRRLEGCITFYPWKDIDRQEETDHPMQFWIKDLLSAR